ncbi:MAG: adenylate/guanylate cyclase domain-containing protein, partial [Oligoflexia bacterium]|nr:adenylate/guanylate cyclase domain-containing protein [Oligoflexia bacterium]
GLLGLVMLWVVADINTRDANRIFVLQGALLVGVALSLSLLFRSRPDQHMPWLKYATIAFDLGVAHLSFLAATANHYGPIEYFHSFMPLVLVQFNLLAGLRYSVLACAWSTLLTAVLGGAILGGVIHTGMITTSPISVWGQNAINIADEVMRLVFVSLSGVLAGVLAYVARRLLHRAEAASTSQAISERQTARLRKYLGHEVANTVASTESGVTLGGSGRRVTVVFVDFRDFTTLSHHTPPQEVVTLLNRYFSQLVDVVFRYQGTLDKFLGDGLMAVWGAPLDRDRTSLRAVLAALEMVAVVDALNAQADSGPRLQVGAGIATGEVVAGNIGSHERMEYTVIGEPVNLAARLETLNRELGSTIVISDQTHQEVARWLPCQAVPDHSRLKGVLADHRAYTVDPAKITPDRLAALGDMVLAKTSPADRDSLALPVHAQTC